LTTLFHYNNCLTNNFKILKRSRQSRIEKGKSIGFATSELDISFEDSSIHFSFSGKLTKTFLRFNLNNSTKLFDIFVEL
jgi:hypothetical protein